LKSLGETIVHPPIAQAFAVINGACACPKPHAIMPAFYNAATSVANTLWRRKPSGRAARSARHRPWNGRVLSNEHLGIFSTSPGAGEPPRCARRSASRSPSAHLVVIEPMMMAGLASRSASACAINCACPKVSPRAHWRDHDPLRSGAVGRGSDDFARMQGTTTGSRLIASPSFPLSVVTGCCAPVPTQ
jgi:hypothetical protein